MPVGLGYGCGGRGWRDGSLVHLPIRFLLLLLLYFSFCVFFGAFSGAFFSAFFSVFLSAFLRAFFSFFFSVFISAFLGAFFSAFLSVHLDGFFIALSSFSFFSVHFQTYFSFHQVHPFLGVIFALRASTTPLPLALTLVSLSWSWGVFCRLGCSLQQWETFSIQKPTLHCIFQSISHRIPQCSSYYI